MTLNEQDAIRVDRCGHNPYATRVAAWLGAICVTVSFVFTTGVLASPLLAADALVGGATQGELARQYIEWAEAQPNSYPTDLLINTRNTAPVAFLPSTYLPSANYALTVGAGTPLFFPIAYGVFWLDNNQTTDGPPCDTAVDRFSCHQAGLKAFMDNPTELFLQVDGERIVIPDAHRFTSQGAPSIVQLDATNVFGLGAVSVFMLFDGWFAALAPLAAGEHLIEYGFTYPGYSVLQVAEVNVVPAPALPMLIFGGALAIGLMRVRSHQAY